MSIISQIPKPSFIFDPSQANENRDVLTQIRRIAEETGQSSPAYTRTGDKLTPAKNGLLTVAPANVPAVSFDQAFNKGYLAEAGATNLLLRSEEFDDAYWSKPNSQIFANQINSPSGVQTADKFAVQSTSSNTKQIQRSISFTTATTYTLSVFAKADEENRILLRVGSDAVSGSARARFDLSDGTIGDIENCVARIEELIFGWFRCSITFTTTATASDNISFWLRGFVSFTGTAGEGLYVWGAQLETGSVATSYIPTTGSTASRGADNLVFTDAQDIIGQQSGVMLVEARWLQNGDNVNHPSGLKLSSSFSAIRGMAIGINDAGSLTFSSRNSAGSSFATIDASYEKGNVVKLLLSYDYQNQEPNTTVTGGGNIFMNGDLAITSNIRVPQAGEEINGLGFIGTTGGDNPSTALSSSNFVKVYLWNNSAWLTDELAQLLTR